MRARNFPALERKVAEVGLGCWQLGAGDWPELSDEAARAVLTAALEAGVDFFDTADVYGAGQSEERLGALLAELGSDAVVATKVGRFPRPGWPENFTPQVLREHVEASLARLRRDTLDLVQLHCVPHAILQREETWEVLRALRSEGKIRAFGASVESSAEARTCLAVEGCASLQLIFNVLRQTPAESLLDEAARRGVAILARLPLASGLLSGRFDASTRFPADDHRSFNRDGAAFHVGETFAGFGFEAGLALVDGLRPLLDGPAGLARRSIRWILDHPAVTVVIPGASRPAQVLENVAAGGDPPLSAEEHGRLRAFYEAEVRPRLRGED